jgi:hypothetical protein
METFRGQAIPGAQTQPHPRRARISDATNKLRPPRLTPAFRMMTLARQLGNILRVLADVAAIRFSIGSSAVTGGVLAFFGGVHNHSPFSLAGACELKPRPGNSFMVRVTKMPDDRSGDPRPLPNFCGNSPSKDTLPIQAT